MTESVAVSPQIFPNEIAEIRAAGFKSVICNRPDGEASDQPLYRELEELARASGLETRFQPVASGRLTDEDAAKFGHLVTDCRNQFLPFAAPARDLPRSGR